MAENEFDPGAHKVGEVTEYLASVPQEERDRVIAAEKDGQARSTILDWTPPQGAQFAQYVGTADVRRVTQKDWESIGIKADTLEWNRGNNFKIPLADVSPDVVNYLQGDSGFKIVEA